MDDFYKPYDERTPDSQYQDRLKQILGEGEYIKETPQDVGALTCFGTLPPMVFDLSNGIPLITERKIGFWRKPVAEIIAFMNGARTIEEIEAFGCSFWESYRGKGEKYGLEPNDMGPGSYGAAFHDFEVPGGGTLNQFAQVIEQIKKYPHARTHLVTPWKPYYAVRGPKRKVIVAPCHGWLHFRVIQDRLDMEMHQRSADFPIGVPSNMFQYAVLLLMVSQITGYRPGRFIHSFADAHIYLNQVERARELAARAPRRFPSVRVDPGVTDLFSFRVEHFALEEYDPHPAMADIPFAA